jgi:tRNA G18 (ribose-2'-O)-methylase SpoU/23S rRNA U2552 (ribose-2'-O)-methylase RlmE/FtsJ
MQARIIAYIQKIAPELSVLADLSSTKKKEAVLFIGKPALAKPESWACDKCTYLNTDMGAMLCIMCDLPRNLQDWAGFGAYGGGGAAAEGAAEGGGGSGGAAAAAAAAVVAADAEEVAAVYATLIRVVKQMAECEALFRTFETGTLHIVTHLARSMDDLQDAFNDEVHGEEVPPVNKIRLRAKAELRERLVTGYKNEAGGLPAGCRLATSGFSHVFAAIEIAAGASDAFKDDQAAGGADDEQPALYAYGTVIAAHDWGYICPNNQSEPTEFARGNKDTVNRAYYKMAELGTHSPLVVASLAANKDTSVALDIGAAPGGWTAYLAERCSRVIAVDPAAMDAGVIAKLNVVHIRAMLLDKTLDGAAITGSSDTSPDTRLASLQAAYTKTYDDIADVAGAGLTLVACDINKQPKEACEISLRALPLLAEGAVFAVTMKFTSKDPSVELVQLEEAKQVMSEHCDQIEVLWLFSNTYHERTLVARYSGPNQMALRPPRADGADGAAGKSQVAPAAPAVREPRHHARMLQVAANRQTKLYAVLENPHNRWNTAAVVRACDSFGITEMLCVWPAGAKERFDPAGKQFVQASSGTNRWVEIKSFDSVQAAADYIAQAEGAPAVHYALSMQSATSSMVYDTDFVAADASTGTAPPVALWFGSTDEMNSLSAEASALATTRVHIPMRGMGVSLNQAVGFTIILSEVTRQRLVSKLDFNLDETGQAALVTAMAAKQ